MRIVKNYTKPDRNLFTKAFWYFNLHTKYQNIKYLTVEVDSVN